MNRLILASLLALFAPLTLAATGTGVLSYTRATQYTDGSALASTDITAHGVQCTFTPTGGTAAPCVMTPTTFAGSASGGTVTLTYPAIGGSACFTITTRTAGAESGPSNVTCKSFAALTPNPPTNVTITVTLTLDVKVNGEPVVANLAVEKP